MNRKILLMFGAVSKEEAIAAYDLGLNQGSVHTCEMVKALVDAFPARPGFGQPERDILKKSLGGIAANFRERALKCEKELEDLGCDSWTDSPT